MSQEPTPFVLFRIGFSRILDGVGVVLLTWLGFQVLFGGSQLFETGALWVGGLGALACWLSPGARRNLPVPLLAYVGIAVLSAAVHRWPVVSSAPTPDWWTIFTPAASHLTMAVYVSGVAHLLRVRARVSLFVVLLASSVCVLAVQLMFDRTVTGFLYNEAGSVSIPSVAQWSGLHQTGLLLLIGLPLVLTTAVVGRTAPEVVASLTLSLMLIVVAFFNGSRSAIAVMVLTTVGMLLAKTLWQRTMASWFRPVLVALITALPLFVWFLTTNVTTSARPWSLSSGRGEIWLAAASVVRDHPWLGVGPGNYTTAMLADGYAERFLYQVAGRYSGAEQAHNLLLHVAAETGVFGAVLLLALFLWLVRGCWEAYRSGALRLVSVGLLFALLAFLLRSMSDNFLDGLVSIDRTRVLVWSLFAAALAVSRLPLHVDSVTRVNQAAPLRRMRVMFALGCLAIVTIEAYVVFGDTDSRFGIEGKQLYDVSEFAAGQSVSHAFLMRGDGMQAVGIRLSSSGVTTARVQWTLWRGFPDQPKEMARAFEGVEAFDLRPGRQWKTIAFTRDGSSKDRWYTLQLRLLDPGQPPTPQVSIVASHDNPDRGGILFINDARKPGSLNLRAERRGRTLYRRFLAEAAPNLPATLRNPAVQWALVIALHWALLVFAYAVLSEACNTAVRRPS